VLCLPRSGYRFMKIAGFLLLLAGWLLVLSALLLLPAGGARSAFVLAGMAVEALALVLVFRSHCIIYRSHE
jgi:hypothetical protein